MKGLVVVAGVLIGLICLGAVAIVILRGRLPLKHSVSRTKRIDRPIDEIYPLIADPERYATCQRDVKGVAIIGTEGDCIRFREDGWDGEVTYELTKNCARSYNLHNPRSGPRLFWKIDI